MSLTFQTWVTFFLLSLVMGINNVYSTLLTGWGEGGSIVAVILCLIFLTKKERNIFNYNLGQTMASAGGSVGFAVAIIASIYYIHDKEGSPWQPSLFDLSLLILSLSLMAVALAVPLRRFIVHWFFPSAVACATILRAVTSEDVNERTRARRIMGISGIFSAILTIPAKIALAPGSPALWSKITLTQSISLSVDPILYGIGLVVGHRIGFSMLLGGLINVLFLTPRLQASSLSVDDYIRWIAVGLMTLPAFTSLIFALIFKSKRELPPGFKPKESLVEDCLTFPQALAVFAVFLVAMGLAIFEMDKLFAISWYYVVVASLVAGPMCFALGKVASETDINPVRLLAISLLFLFSIFESHSPVALLAIGISGATFASVAVDLFYDLRTGYLIRANPKQQLVMQFLGVIPVAFATVYFLDMLASHFGIGEGQYFPAPGAIVWATMAEAFSGDAEEISSGIWYAAGIASVIGIFLTLFENWKPTKFIAPSAFAIGIALLLPFEMASAIFVGSILRLIVITIAKSRGKDILRIAEEGAFKSGSAIFAASSLAGIIAVILITFGMAFVPQ